MARGARRDGVWPADHLTVRNSVGHHSDNGITGWATCREWS
ncbi:MAG: hypothetical protein AB2A00_15800 [Myxococcota bacterium]